MKSFHEYLAESVKEYQYRIKSIVPIDDAFLDRLETVLRKYDIVDVSSPKRTMVQKNPLDFKDIGHAEVYIVDVTTRIPASSYIMLQELRGVLNIPEKYLVVRGTNEPLELQTQAIQAFAEIEAEASEKGLTQAPLLDASPDYEEVDYDAQPEPAYGDAYNKKFLNYLGNVKHERPDMTAEPSTEKKPAKFSWLAGAGEVKAQDPADVGVHGNFEDKKKSYRRTYSNSEGKPVAIQRKADK